MWGLQNIMVLVDVAKYYNLRNFNIIFFFFFAYLSRSSCLFSPPLLACFVICPNIYLSKYIYAIFLLVHASESNVRIASKTERAIHPIQRNVWLFIYTQV